ncbi:uncharacterized protein LOC114966871 [Acropora millepora]|uniref:uncharacterized protein LOC114966871 n=1 Tax=Acropora millepora TaxID=45264 RepID=UPI001CF4DC9C|nr:uncharacterized protein LOC114966871 [Acropora millepora]
MRLMIETRCEIRNIFKAGCLSKMRRQERDMLYFEGGIGDRMATCGIVKLTQVENSNPLLERPVETIKVVDKSNENGESQSDSENVAEKTTSATSTTIAAPVPAPWSWFASLSIDEQFLLLGKRRVCVPGDGHCLLHSWLRVLQAEGERENQTPVDLLNDVNKEIEDNLLVHYVAFLTGDWNLQMEAYLYHRVYNSDVVDLVIFALSNLSARICELYTVEDSGSVKKAFVITPWKEERAKLAREKPTLSLLFRGKHYDPLLNIDLSALDDISENLSVKTTVEQEEEDTSDEEKDTTNENESKAESTSLLDEEGVTKDQRPEPVVPEIADPVRKATKDTITVSAVELELKQESLRCLGKIEKKELSQGALSTKESKDDVHVKNEENSDKDSHKMSKQESDVSLKQVESAESAEDNEDSQEMTENVTPDDSVKTQDIEADSVGCQESDETSTLEDLCEIKTSRSFLKRMKNRLGKAVKCCFPCIFKKDKN